MQARPSRTNLIHFGVMVAVLVGALGVAAASAGRPVGMPVSAPGTEAGAGSAKSPKVDATLTGTVGTRTNAKGRTEYTLTSGDTTVVLDAGKVKARRDGHPLEPYVGKQVTIGGKQREGSQKVKVVTVDGTALRELRRRSSGEGSERSDTRRSDMDRN